MRMTKTKMLLLVWVLVLLMGLGYERRVYVCLEDGMLVNEYRLCGVTIHREEEATAVSEMVGDGTCAHEDSARVLALSFRQFSGGVSPTYHWGDLPNRMRQLEMKWEMNEVSEEEREVQAREFLEEVRSAE